MTDLVPDTWDSAVTKILTQKYYACVPYEPNLGQRQHIQTHVLVWKIALIQMLKIEEEIKGKLKLPFTPQLVELLKPHAKHLHSIYILCKECHMGQPFLSYELPYKHGFEWLHLIYKELINEGITDVLHPSTQSSSADRKKLLDNGEIKRHTLRELNDNCTMVANYENPFRENPGLHNLSSLLDAAILLAESRPSFNNRYFKPYIKSWRAMLKSMESPRFTRHFVKEGELHCQSGSGRRVRNITKESQPRKPLLGKGSKTYQQLFKKH